MGKHITMVTGGTGLVGNGIKLYLQEKGLLDETWIFTGIEDGFDIIKKEDCRALFEKYRPTRVIHLAARVGGLFANLKYKVEFYRENILLNDNVMECCREFKVQKLVSCLSTCVFPDKTSYPIDETMIHNGAPHSSNEGYAYAKRMIDVMNRCYREEYGCNFTAVIPTNVYGPYDNYSLESSHVIPGLIHKCYLAKKANEPFIVLGTGRPLRQFVHNKDLGALFCWVLEKYHDPEPLILSVDEADEVSICDVAHWIAEAMEFKGELKFDPSAADGQFKKTASNAKLRALNPEFKFTSMKDGITDAVKWFIENYDIARK